MKYFNDLIDLFIAWSWGQAQPTPYVLVTVSFVYHKLTHNASNMWSWTNLSHVLWVEQPVGVRSYIPAS